MEHKPGGLSVKIFSPERFARHKINRHCVSDWIRQTTRWSLIRSINIDTRNVSEVVKIAISLASVEGK